MASPQEQKLTMYIASLKRLSLERKNQLLKLLLSEGLSERVKSLCKLLDIPIDGKREEIREIKYIAPASHVFNFLPDDTKFCGHFVFKPQAYGTIFIGPHKKEQDCLPLSFAEAKKIGQDFLHKESFAFSIGGYAIEEIKVFTNGEIVAKCFGYKREFILSRGKI